jgi:hypothetical protein
MWHFLIFPPKVYNSEVSGFSQDMSQIFLSFIVFIGGPGRGGVIVKFHCRVGWGSDVQLSCFWPYMYLYIFFKEDFVATT